MSGSKLAVGSSKKRISGSFIRDFANEILFFWPDDNSPVFLLKKMFRFSSSDTSFILLSKFLTPYSLP